MIERKKGGYAALFFETNNRHQLKSMKAVTQKVLTFLVMAMSITLSLTVNAARAENPVFNTLLIQLADANFSEKAQLIEQIAALKHEKSEIILIALLEGNLHYRKEDNVAVFATETEEGYRITDALTDVEYGEVGSRDIKKIGVNNELRQQLTLLISSIQLADTEASKRLYSARNILRNPDPLLAAVIEHALLIEKDFAVRTQLASAQAAILLVTEETDVEARIAAITRLGEVSDKAVINLLSKYTLKNDDGSFAEPDAKVRLAAVAALKKLTDEAQWYGFLENLFFGMSLGSVLLLAAVGLAITFGVMGVINMAHGEMIMLGAYTTYVIQLLMPNHIGASLLVAIPAAFLVSALMGILIERTIIRHLYGRPLETLLATFGVSLILQQLVRSIFSPLNRSVITPDWLSGSWEVNGMLSLTYNRLAIIVFSLLVLGALMLLMRKTFFGLQMRAVTQNRAMASSMGIKTGWIDALTFGLGSGIAGIAGVALSQLTNVGPNLGQNYIIDSFLVVVFGGVGNLFGTFFAAMTLGIANKFMEPLAGAVLAKILILIFIILFIQRKPRGLFALKGRFVED
jgi:urea transport system permease protein